MSDTIFIYVKREISTATTTAFPVFLLVTQFMDALNSLVQLSKWWTLLKGIR